MLAIAVASVGVHVNFGSGRTLLALTPVFVLLVGLIVYCLVDLVRTPAVLYLPKWAWALVILFASAPLGPIAYLLFGKDRHGGGRGARREDSDEPDTDRDIAA